MNGHAVIDLDAQFFRDGKAVLGDKAGGVLVKLKKAKGLEAASRVIRDAATKENPMEYVQGALRSTPAKRRSSDPAL